MISDLLAFAGVIALGQFSPGPDMLLITRTALAQGRSAGWWTTAGITTGLCVHATVAVFGMAYLMAQGGWVTGVLRWVAVGYLAYLGFRLLPTAFVVMRQGRPHGEGGSEKGRSAYVRGLLCNILNPKVAIIFAAVVTEFVTGDRPVWWAPVLWIIIVGQGFFLWWLYVWLLQFPLFRNGYQRAGPWFDSAFGAGLLTLAVLLAITQAPA